jgi:hypothetical protein
MTVGNFSGPEASAASSAAAAGRIEIPIAEQDRITARGSRFTANPYVNGFLWPAVWTPEMGSTREKLPIDHRVSEENDSVIQCFTV